MALLSTCHCSETITVYELITMMRDKAQTPVKTSVADRNVWFTAANQIAAAYTEYRRQMLLHGKRYFNGLDFKNDNASEDWFETLPAVNLFDNSTYVRYGRDIHGTNRSVLEAVVSGLLQQTAAEDRIESVYNGSSSSDDTSESLTPELRQIQRQTQNFWVDCVELAEKNHVLAKRFYEIVNRQIPQWQKQQETHLKYLKLIDNDSGELEHIYDAAVYNRAGNVILEDWNQIIIKSETTHTNLKTNLFNATVQFERQYTEREERVALWKDKLAKFQQAWQIYYGSVLQVEWCSLLQTLAEQLRTELMSLQASASEVKLPQAEYDTILSQLQTRLRHLVAVQYGDNEAYENSKKVLAKITLELDLSELSYEFSNSVRSLCELNQLDALRETIKVQKTLLPTMQRVWTQKASVAMQPALRQLVIKARSEMQSELTWWSTTVNKIYKQLYDTANSKKQEIVDRFRLFPDWTSSDSAMWSDRCPEFQRSMVSQWWQEVKNLQLSAAHRLGPDVRYWKQQMQDIYPLANVLSLQSVWDLFRCLHLLKLAESQDLSLGGSEDVA